MRRLGVALVLVALTACGQETASPPQAPYTPRLRTITPAKARAVAKAALLKPADVPGYRVGESGDPTDHNVDTSGCLEHESAYLAERRTSYSNEKFSVDSDVDVAPTVDHVTDDMEALLGKEFLDCYQTVISALLGTIGITVEKYASRRFAVRVPGADAAAGVSVRFTLRYDVVRARGQIVVLTASTGHARIEVSGAGDPDAQPVSYLRSLLAKSVKRARAAQR